MRYFKGICKFPHIKNLLTSHGYVEHFVQPDGTYVITTTKNTFEMVPRSVQYYDVFLVR
jgi:hypothetical protein